MRKLIFLAFNLGVILLASAQSVSINITATPPDPSSILDVSSNSKGLLIPRMGTASINAIVNPAKGLLVYDSVKNQLVVNMGTPAIPNWQTVVFNSGWNLTGNTGIDTSQNFLGTKDKKPLIIRVNNQIAGSLDTSNNVVFGTNAGLLNSGFDNVVLGHNAFANGGGGEQVVIGANALSSNRNGIWNTIVGSYGLGSHRTGSSNTAIGYAVLANDTSGGSNTGLGFETLFNNLNGFNNTAIGIYTLFSNTEGSFNIGGGSGALYSNTTGSENTGFGRRAMYANTTGYSNVAIGNWAMFSNSDRSNLVAIGDSALLNNGIGVTGPLDAVQNTAVGSKALSANTIGSNNTAVGFHALQSNISGTTNTGFGAFALSTNTTGGGNTALGWAALNYNSNGVANTASGVYALLFNTGGSSNTANGHQALYQNTAGFQNTALGRNALLTNTTGSNNTGLGFGADVSTGALTNSTAIGYNAIVSSSNTIQLGNTSVTTVSTSGNITVQNGKGLIRSNDGTQQKKVVTIVTVNASIGPNSTINIPFSFSESFSAAPDVYVGNVSNPGAGGFAELVLTVSGVSTGGATLFVFNPRTGFTSPNYSIKIIAIGPQ